MYIVHYQIYCSFNLVCSLETNLNLIVSILTKLIKNILVIYKHLSSWDKQQLQSVRRIFPVFLLLLILACAVPASSRAKVLSTGTFRDPLEKWGSTREENYRKKIKQQSLCLKLGDSSWSSLPWTRLSVPEIFFFSSWKTKIHRKPRFKVVKWWLKLISLITWNLWVSL